MIPFFLPVYFAVTNMENKNNRSDLWRIAKNSEQTQTLP